MRVKGQREELRGVVEKMNEEQSSLFTALGSKNHGAPIDVQTTVRLEQELKAAREYIIKMQHANTQLEIQYRNKMK